MASATEKRRKAIEAINEMSLNKIVTPAMAVKLKRVIYTVGDDYLDLKG